MSLSFDRTQEKFLRCRKMSPTMFIQKLSETIKSCSFGKIVCDINLKYKPLSVLSVLSLYIVRAFLCLFPSFLYKVSELQNRLLNQCEIALCLAFYFYLPNRAVANDAQRVDHSSFSVA